jgi:uncharacterized protein with HEPN domain
MQRDYKIYLNDILDAIKRIEEYTNGLSLADFKNNRLKQDAVIRNLIVIGEAAKGLPENARPTDKEVDWNKIAGLRDIVVHQYFNVDIETIWSIVTSNIQPLKKLVAKHLGK